MVRIATRPPFGHSGAMLVETHGPPHPTPHWGEGWVRGTTRRRSSGSAETNQTYAVAFGQVVLIQFAAAVDSLWLVPGFGQPIGAVMLRIGMVMMRSGSHDENSYCGRFLLKPVTASL